MKRLFRHQILLLFIGTVFAWFTVVQDLLRFFNIEGTLFRVQDCAMPNPVVTPCFWGAWAFLIALIWAVAIAKRSGDVQQIQQKRLLWLLVAGTIFAWSNNTYELIKFYTAKGAEPTIGCSGQLVTNPFITPCFIGATLFLASLILGYIAYRSIRKNK